MTLRSCGTPPPPLKPTISKRRLLRKAGKFLGEKQITQQRSSIKIKQNYKNKLTFMNLFHKKIYATTATIITRMTNIDTTHAKMTLPFFKTSFVKLRLR